MFPAPLVAMESEPAVFFFGRLLDRIEHAEGLRHILTGCTQLDNSTVEITARALGSVCFSRKSAQPICLDWDLILHPGCPWWRSPTAQPSFLFAYLFISLSSALGIPSGSGCMHLAIGSLRKEECRRPLPRAQALENQSHVEAAPLRLQQGQRLV